LTQNLAELKHANRAQNGAGTRGAAGRLNWPRGGHTPKAMVNGALGGGPGKMGASGATCPERKLGLQNRTSQ